MSIAPTGAISAPQSPDDDVGDRPAHALTKRRPKRRFRCEGGVDHRHRKEARRDHDPMDVHDDPRHGGLRSRRRAAKIQKGGRIACAGVAGSEEDAVERA
jgi:hypothetical protein